MKRKNLIIIFSIVLIVMIFVIVKINKKTNNNANEIQKVSVEKKSDEEVKKETIENFKDKLKENKIILTNETEIESSAIGLSGYSYTVNGETIEVYYANVSKLEEMGIDILEKGEVTLKLKDSEIKALKYENILILNCTNDEIKKEITTKKRPEEKNLRNRKERELY